MALVGGIRDRMVQHSVRVAVEAHLTTLGWFTPGRYHRPIVVVDEYPEDDVAINTLAFSTALGFGIPEEMGTRGEIHHTAMFVDFFAESDALGKHVIGDVYAYMKTNPVIPVYDYREDEPRDVEFHVEVMDDAEKRKPTNATNAWQRNWYTCSFTLEDVRANA